MSRGPRQRASPPTRRTSGPSGGLAAEFQQAVAARTRRLLELRDDLSPAEARDMAVEGLKHEGLLPPGWAPSDGEA